MADRMWVTSFIAARSSGTSGSPQYNPCILRPLGSGFQVSQYRKGRVGAVVARHYRAQEPPRPTVLGRSLSHTGGGRVAYSGLIDISAQNEVLCARRSDTPAQVRVK